MPEVRQAIEQATRFWKELSRKQQVLLAGGSALTLALLLLFVRQAASPSFKVLLTGLTPADAQAIGTQLDAKNIKHQLDAAGTTLSVASDQLDAARLEVASQGMPHSGRLGFEIFDKSSWGETEFDEKVNYQRALEGELERTIQGLRNVETARVHLVLPADSVFIDRQRAAKASVILRLRRGGLSPETQQVIGRLVAGAVDGLDPDNVAVIDADTNRPLGGGRAEEAGGLGEQLTRRLLATLAPVLGAEHVRASVNVEYDPTTTEESQERYDPAATVTLAMQRSEERIGAGSAAGGVPGTSSNVPGAKPESAPKTDPEANNQNTTTESATYGVNKTVRRTSEPAGRIRRITAALLVDDQVVKKDDGGKSTTQRRKWSNDELKQVQDLAQASLGLDASRGDLISVQNISFDQSAPPPILPAPLTERIRTVLQDWSNVLRYAVILLLFLVTYALVIRPLKRQAITTMKELQARGRSSSSEAPVALTPGTETAPEAALGLAQEKTKQLKKQILDKVKHEPVPSSRLVQAWLREE